MEKKLYIYTTKTYREKGWYKIGETTKLVKDRVNQQDKTSNPEKLEIIYEIPSIISDKNIHKTLKQLGYKKCRNKREWFEGFKDDDDVISVINRIISKSKKDTRMEYVPRFYQDVVNMMFIEKLNNVNTDVIDFALELAPRFGKTIWEIDLIYTLFKKYEYKICILPTYVLTSLTSFNNELHKFKGYSDKMVFINLNDDVEGIINEFYGKKMIIVEVSLMINDYKTKLELIKSLRSEDKVCFMDEADFGTHRNNSQEIIQYIGSKLNVYMTGTAIERVINPLENLEDNVIRWSYTDMLMVKKGEHPLQKHLIN
jgi:hypothetical protein